jgi:hypothetical protein
VNINVDERGDESNLISISCCLFLPEWLRSVWLRASVGGDVEFADDRFFFFLSVELNPDPGPTPDPDRS